MGDAIIIGRKILWLGLTTSLALLGLDDVVVVSTKDATIVASKDRSQDANLVPAQLKAAKRSEWELHREVYRPWGKYDSL